MYKISVTVKDVTITEEYESKPYGREHHNDLIDQLIEKVHQAANQPVMIPDITLDGNALRIVMNRANDNLSA